MSGMASISSENKKKKFIIDLSIEKYNDALNDYLLYKNIFN